jgi:ribosomal protein S18 acetylase RimI-like enzyme
VAAGRDDSLSKDDFYTLAVLHKKGIAKGFLSSLGERFLAILYRGISRHPGSCVLVERDESGEVIGFISGTLSISDCYKHVIMHNFLSLGVPIMLKMASIKRIKNLFETLMYPTRKDKQKGKVEAELLSMAVSDKARGKGIGKKLVNRLEGFLKVNGFSSTYKVVTSADDERSNGFYKSVGFVFNREFRHHGNLLNEFFKEIEEEGI